MRYAIIAALALGACATPEDRAASVCQGAIPDWKGRGAEYADCVTRTYAAVLQSETVRGGNMMALGAAMYSAGQPRMLAPPAASQIICRSIGNGTTVCN